MSDVRQQAAELLDAHLGRGALKRAGAALDADEALRDAVIAEALRRGVDLSDDDRQGPGKRLLRRARARESAARVRTNPIARDEAFECAHCGLDVPPHGRTARDHCPACLRSLHVDVVPGDRAAGCGGILDPVSVEALGGDAWRLHYTCRRCGAQRANRVLRDGDPPDDWKAVIALTRTGTP